MCVCAAQVLPINLRYLESSFRDTTVPPFRMRAIRVSHFGDSNVLEYSSGVQLPKLKENEVLIQVKAIGVNPVDTYIRSGNFPLKPDLPFTPGFDVAGIIRELGSKDIESEFFVGQRVFASNTTSGGYAEMCNVPAKACYPLDDKLTFQQGAALGIPYLTAYRALFMKAKPECGQTVLVHGASGAVGLALVQLAVGQKNLRVFGTAGSEAGLKLVQEQGADKVFNHHNKSYVQQILEATDGKGVDIIFEMLANVNLNKDCDMASFQGKIFIIGNRGAVDFDASSVMMKELSINGIAVLHSSEIEANAQAKGLIEAIKTGSVNPVIGKEFSLKNANIAHDYIIDNSGSSGKVVLVID